MRRILLTQLAALVGLAPLLLAQPAVPVRARTTPLEYVKLAAADAKPLGPAAKYVWYLALPDGPVEERTRLRRQVDFVLNSLSSRKVVTRTLALPNERDPLLLRVDLNAYGLDPAAITRLIDKGSGSVPLPEPYFYLTLERVVEEQWPGGTWTDGKHYEAGPYKTRKKVQSIAPWVATDGGTAAEILTTSCQTRTPIARADWFVAYASWAPAYYDLLGIKKNTEKEFEQLMLVDEEKGRKNQVASAANTQLVTLHNRLLFRYPTAGGYLSGYYWFSIDTDNGIDQEDYLNNLERFDRPKFKAKEIISSRINGLQAYAVADNKAKLLNVAAASIARHSDTMPTLLEDKQIFSGLRNCTFCHWGLQPIKCKVRSLAQGEIALVQLLNGHGKDKDLAARFQDAFQPDINGFVAHDSTLYAAAVKSVNGLDAKVNSNQFEQVTYDYLDRPITLAQAALEAGTTEAELAKLIRAASGLDHTLVGLIQNPQVPAGRINWERRGYAQMMLISAGLDLARLQGGK